MENPTMLGTPEAVVGGTEGGPGLPGVHWTANLNTPGRTQTCRLLSGVAIPSRLAPPLERS
jgi:hypothetical protein